MSERQGSNTKKAPSRPPLSSASRPPRGEKDSSQLRRSASGSCGPMPSRSKRSRASSDSPIGPRPDLHPTLRDSVKRYAKEGLMELRARVHHKLPRSSSQETHHSEPDITPGNHRGGKQGMDSSQMVPLKQPEPKTVEQPRGPRIALTSPNQYDLQEAQLASTRVTTFVPNGNNEMVNVHHFEQNAAQRTQKDQTGIIVSLEVELRQTRAYLQAAEQQLQDQTKDLEYLRHKVTENATRSIELPLQLPLHCPEGEIMKDWHTLTYDVGNLVSNYFRESKEAKVVAWAKKESKHIRNLTPDYEAVVKDKKTAPAFIEAAIWNALCLCVFGPYRNNAPFCWAGKYRASLRTMSNFLLADVHMLKSDKHRHKAMFHQWKALTANLVATIVSQERQDSEKDEISEDLADMLDGLYSPRTSQDCLNNLKAIVQKAVGLTMKLCGQKRWYCVIWHPKSSHGASLDEERMELMADSPRSNYVRFLVRPGLYGSQGEDYDNMSVLDRCRVWAA